MILVPLQARRTAVFEVFQQIDLALALLGHAPAVRVIGTHNRDLFINDDEFGVDVGRRSSWRTQGAGDLAGATGRAFGVWNREKQGHSFLVLLR